MNKEAAKEIRKPPLGLEPRWHHEGQRLMDILDAMERYDKASVEWDLDWIVELRSLINSPHVKPEDLKKARAKIVSREQYVRNQPK